MRLFISYARVDKPYCVQIVDLLEVHDVWYDHRLHAGQDWWQEIQKQLTLCEGFIYLLSPESVASEYCQKEFMIARQLDKHIFPVIIQPRVQLPDALKQLQYADLTRGLTPEGVKQLLNAIYIAERAKSMPHHKPQLEHVKHRTLELIGGDFCSQDYKSDMKANVALSTFDDPAALINEVGDAIEQKDFDRVVFLLKQARSEGCVSRFINLEAMLQEAEAALEKQAYLREAQREYRPILAMVKQSKMRKLGCHAFQKYREHFPDYDPENIASTCATELIPMLEWCDIPGGEVTLVAPERDVIYYVDSFRMSKYPVTNAQYQIFLSARDGYVNPKWWQFSTEAMNWHKQHPRPLAAKFPWGSHPRANVNWYEAMAFCGWMSFRSGLHVTLPSEQQWQRAAQGDDSRIYPWGDKFDKQSCNCRENGLRMTTDIRKYEKTGASPYGVCDMVGNVWEWCSTMDTKQQDALHNPRAVRGGSFNSVMNRAKSTFRFYLNPTYRYATIGFRIVIA